MADAIPQIDDESIEFELYITKDDSHLGCMEGDLKGDVIAFLLPFKQKYIGPKFNQMALTKAKEVIETVDIRFVCQCAMEIGAPKSWIGDKAREQLIL